MFAQFIQIFLMLALCLMPSFAQADTSAPILPQTGQTTSYSAGDDGALQIGVSWPSLRFTDNTNGTVTDTLTGLVWLKNANCFGSKDWSTAIATVTGLSSGACGLTDGSNVGQWRLPNVLELRSLVNDQQASLAGWLNTQGFTNVLANYYWSSGTYSSNSDNALSFNMYDSSLFVNQKFVNVNVWPVRDSPTTGVIQLPKTGQSTSFTTGDDGSLQKGKDWPIPRFVDNSVSDPQNLTVTDTLTNLVWTKDGNAPGPAACSPATIKTWQGALDYVSCLNSNNFLGKADWRLPNGIELTSLVNYSQSSQAVWLNTQGFISVLADYYWTSSTSAYNTNLARHIDMAFGLESGASKYSNYYVWPVRGGHWALDSLNFYGLFNLGIRNVNQTAATKIVTLHNSSTTSQVVTTINISGTNSNQFSIATGGDTPCSSLSPTLAAHSKCRFFRKLVAG